MDDYKLYYWPVPFRGEFVRSVLAYVDASWREAGFDETLSQKGLEPHAQLIPHMGPPLLTDLRRDVHISQLPAILSYLAELHALLPEGPMSRAMCQKVIGDANDVLYEMTRHNGAQIWTQADWNAYLPRLGRWMEIFEETGLRHGLTAQSGFILGTQTPCLADLVTATLWGTMTAKLQPLRPILEQHAPAIAGLSHRIAAIPSQSELRRRSDSSFGNTWCGGDIEASLRAVI